MGRPGGNKIFPLPPKIKLPNSHIVRYTCQFEQYLPHTQNESRAHPNWAPTKEPTVSSWRYTPTPKQDRFQDLLEDICLEFLHTNLTKYNNYHCYSNKPQLLSAEVVLCTHKTTICCQFGLFICHQLTNSYLQQFSTIFGGNCIRLTVLSFDSQANQSNQISIQRELLMSSPEVIDLTLSDDEIQPDPI